jgi:hypothetical protein
MLGILALQDAGYIIGAYAITFAAIGTFTWRVLSSGRKLADQIDDTDKYWT